MRWLALLLLPSFATAQIFTKQVDADLNGVFENPLGGFAFSGERADGAIVGHVDAAGGALWTRVLDRPGHWHDDPARFERRPVGVTFLP